MYRTVGPIIQVLLAVACVEFALGALSPLIGTQLVRLEVPTEWIGIITSAYFVGFLAGTLTAHHVIDRVGHIRAFTALAAVAAIAVLLHILVREPIAWGVWRACIGYAIAGLFVVIESWLNDKATSDNRGRLFGIYLVVSWGASGAGPLALNLHDPDGIRLFALITTMMCCALIPMALTRVGNPEIGHRTRFGIRRLYRLSPLGTAACFGSGLINTSLWGLLPVYGTTIGLDAGQLSVVLSVSIMGGLLVQYPIGALSDRFGRRPLMLGTALAGIAVALLLASLGRPPFPLLVALTALLGGFVAPLYALGIGQTNDYIERRDFVAASASLLFAWGVGSSVGPALAAALMAPLGPPGLFVFIAGGLAAFAGFTVWRILRRPAKTPLAQGHYVAVPQTQGTYGAPELDPRGAPPPAPPLPANLID
ncbi:MAG: MFS transporter [Dongiaceae bacterium]